MRPTHSDDGVTEGCIQKTLRMALSHGIGVDLDGVPGIAVEMITHWRDSPVKKTDWIIR